MIFDLLKFSKNPKLSVISMYVNNKKSNEFKIWLRHINLKCKKFLLNKNCLNFLSVVSPLWLPKSYHRKNLTYWGFDWHCIGNLIIKRDNWWMVFTISMSQEILDHVMMRNHQNSLVRFSIFSYYSFHFLRS